MSELDNPNNYTTDIGISETRKKSEWLPKTKYEYVNIAIDLTMHDPNGTLDIATVQDKDSCKRIPQVKIVDGFLVVALRRDIL